MAGAWRDGDTSCQQCGVGISAKGIGWDGFKMETRCSRIFLAKIKHSLVEGNTRFRSGWLSGRPPFASHAAEALALLSAGTWLFG